MRDETPKSFVDAALSTFERLGELARERPSSERVLARWSPMVGALQRFGFTLFQVGNHLWALSKTDEDELMPAELAAEVRDDLRAIAEAFPGIDEVIFGTDAVDDFIDHAIENVGVRSAFKSAGSVVSQTIDRIVGGLVETALEPDAAAISGTDLSVYFDRLERVLDKILDRWLREAAP